LSSTSSTSHYEQSHQDADLQKSQKQTFASTIGIQLSDLSKSFAQNLVLDQINLELKPGSFHVLIGPSGCGKTTLLRLIGGLEQASSGSVEFIDYTTQQIMPGLEAHTAASPYLSYGFQEPRLLSWQTVYDNVALPLKLSGMSTEKMEEKVVSVLSKVGLNHALQLYPNQLSGGMKMRAAIARALVTEPKVLLLDEPFGALDEITKNRLDDELLSLWKELQMTVVLVTHSLSEAIYLGEYIHVLAPQPGRLLETLPVLFKDRSPALKLSPEFTMKVAEAHSLLEKAEGIS
jgi:NitT/TauT family transport system ATP-binding protein